MMSGDGPKQNNGLLSQKVRKSQSSQILFITLSMGILILKVADVFVLSGAAWF